MTDEILILKNREPQPVQTKDIQAGLETKNPEPLLKIEQVMEDIREINSIRQGKGVLAAAQAMPLKLHKPIREAELKSTTQKELWGLEATHATKTTCRGIGTTVAVLDTGIHRQHEAFNDLRNQIVEKDFSGDGDGDTDGHGTHCAATIFGGYVGDVRVGIASNISKALIGKVFGSRECSTAVLGKGIDWALANGANIISMSCGIDYPGMVKQLKKTLPEKYAVARALEAYRDTIGFFSAIAQRASFALQPVLFIAAAGNSSESDDDPAYVIGPEPPAVANGFISVSALFRKQGCKEFGVASFSNGGAQVAAPGVGIISAQTRTDSGLISMDGTSMATPHVTGIAALWYEHLRKKPNVVVTNELLRVSLLGNARLEQIADNRISDTGSGLVKAPN